jgi:hypothetical protein
MPKWCVAVFPDECGHAYLPSTGVDKEHASGAFLLSYIFETLPKSTQSQKTQEGNYQCIGIRTWGFIVCEP